MIRMHFFFKSVSGSISLPWHQRDPDTDTDPEKNENPTSDRDPLSRTGSYRQGSYYALFVHSFKTAREFLVGALTVHCEPAAGSKGKRIRFSAYRSRPRVL